MDKRSSESLTQEDLFLRNKVENSEKVNWTEIVDSVNKEFPNRERSSKQCRERYINHSSLSVVDQQCFEWTQEDLEVLESGFVRFGTRWTRITQTLPGKYFNKLSRSENSIKNKFYGMLRKAVRTINNVGKSMKKKIKKNIRYQSIVRIIEAPECFHSLNQDLKRESLLLRDKILEFMRFTTKVKCYDEVSELIERINKFNLATRSHRAKRLRGIMCEEKEIIMSENINISKPNMSEANFRNKCNTSTQTSSKRILSKEIQLNGFESAKCDSNQEFSGIINTQPSDSFIEFDEIYVAGKKEEPIELFDFLLNRQTKTDSVEEGANLMI